MKVNAKHIGTTFDSFLQDDGIAADVEMAAAKRITTLQVERLMEKSGVTKSELARRMRTSRAQVARLLDPGTPSVNLATLFKAAAALGKTVRLSLVEPMASSANPVRQPPRAARKPDALRRRVAA
jgi:hypothetical protein